MNINNTYIRQRNREISKLRLKIINLCKELNIKILKLIDRNFHIRGTVYKMAGKCGKKSCKCYKTDYSHEVWRLAKSVSGKMTARVISKGDLNKVKTLTENYRRYVMTKNEVKEIEKEINSKILELAIAKGIEYYGKGKFKAK